MKRTVTPELLDTDQGTAEEVAASLADLRWFNRYFGGQATTTHLLSHVAEVTGLMQLSFLDVAGASGDVALGARDKLAQRGIGLQVAVLDRSGTHLPHKDARNGIVSLVGDALHIPFADRSFDVVGSSLFIHHLEPNEIIQFINEALRVCRHAVIINDLQRHALHLATVYAGIPLYGSRITRNDAPASVRRAYTPDEMKRILLKTDADQVEFTKHYFYRMGIVVWRRQENS